MCFRRASSRFLLLAPVLLLCSAAPVEAQRRIGFASGGGGISQHVANYGSFSGFGGYGHGFGYFPGFGFPGFDHGFGGYGWNNYPPYPYPAYLPQHPSYSVVIAEATHDWRFWDPTSRVLLEPMPKECVLGKEHHQIARAAFGSVIVTERSVPAPAGERVIGMGVPTWIQPSPPLGDIARQYRQLSARGAEQVARVAAFLR